MTIRENKQLKRLITTVAIALFIFEQSPANEAIRAFMGFKVLDATGNAYLVGVAVGIITLVVELVSSLLIALALNHNHRFKRLSQRFTRNSKEGTTKNTLSDYLLALGIGAGSLVIKKHLKNKWQTFSKDVKVALKASLVIAAFSAFIGFLAGGGIELARSVGFGVQAQYFLDLVTDWRFWLVIVLGSQLIELIGYRRKNKT